MSFTSTNPATNEILWEGSSASPQEVDAAIAKAQNAFKSWSETPLEERIDHLKRFEATLTQSQDRVAETISKEVGKPLWESKAEVSAMIGKIGISIDAYHDRCRQIEKELPAGHSITRHRPHGVVAVFGPFNFPGHLPNGHIVPALLAGNTIVFKPSELTPLVGEVMVDLWKKSGIPSGVINTVQGGAETGKTLAYHPEINGLFFTGSWKVGKQLSEHFGKHPEKILALEMGGNNPLIVTKTRDIKAAVYHTIQSAFITSGQRCSCARRLIVPVGDQGDSFIQELLQAVEEIKVAPYTDDPEPFMGPLITLEAATRMLETQEALLQQGAIPLLSVQRAQAILTPGILDVTLVSNRVDREVFGPLLQIIRVPDFSSAIIEANNTAYGLAAGLLSDDPEQYQVFYCESRAGVVNWNTQLTGASSAAPFGGIGHSGNHRPSAYYAADYCSFPVASLENQHLSLPPKLTPGLTL